MSDTLGPLGLPPPELPPLEELIRRIRSRTLPVGLPAPPEPEPPRPAPPPPPEPPSTWQKTKEVAGELAAAPGIPFRYLARKVYEAEFPHAGEVTIPGARYEHGIPTADVGAMLERAAFPEPPTTTAGGAVHELARVAGETLTDPVSMAMIGGVAAGAPKIVHLGLMGLMGTDMAQRAYRAVQVARERGLGPELGREIGGLTADAALILGPMAYDRVMHPRAPGNAEVEAAAAETPVAPPSPPAAPGEPPPPRPPFIGPRYPYEAPAGTPAHQAADVAVREWASAYREAVENGADPLIAASIADDRLQQALGTTARPTIEPAPPVAPEMGPPPATAGPPEPDPDNTAAVAVEAQKQKLREGIAAAQAADDWLTEGTLRRQLGELQAAGAKAGAAPRPAAPPAPGTISARPEPPIQPGPPMPGPGGQMLAGPPLPRPAPEEAPPGPRAETTVTPALQQPTAAGEAGETTPIEAAAERMGEARPGVQALVKAGERAATGEGGETLPPGVTVVSGPTRGAGARALEPTPPGPAIPLPAPPVAPPVAPMGAAPPPGPALATGAAPPPPQPQEERPIAPGAPQAPASSGEAPAGRITLRKEGRQWVADHEGPVGEVIKAKTGGRTTIPLPWHADTPAEEIRQAIHARNPSIEVLVAGEELRRAPEPELEKPKPKFRVAEASPEAVRGDIGRGPQGTGWVVRTYGRDDKVTSESDLYAAKAEAKAALSELQPKLQSNRRELRKREISPDEESWAAMAPEDWQAKTRAGTPENPNELALDEQRAFIESGKTTKLYRAVRAAHTMNRPVNEGWYKVFPMLRRVPKTGERGKARPEETRAAPNLEEILAWAESADAAASGFTGPLIERLQSMEDAAETVERGEAGGYTKWPSKEIRKAVVFAQRREREAARPSKPEPEPTPAQMEAGNYRKGHRTVQGLDITVETAKGGVRRAKDGSWKVENFPADYGYIKRTEGADGEQMDVYVGGHPEADTVYVVDQVDADTGAFDEHKAMLGFPSEEAALQTYRRGFSDGRADERIGAVTPMTVEGFKEWLKAGETAKPLGALRREAARPAPAPARPAVVTDPELFDAIRNAIAEGEPAPRTPDELRSFVADTLLLEAESKMDDATARAYLQELVEAPGEEETPEAEPAAPTPVREDLIGGQVPEQKQAWERLLERVPEAKREEARDAIQQALAVAPRVRDARLDVEHFQRPTGHVPNRPAKLRAAKAQLGSMQARLEAHVESLQAFAPGEEGRLLVRRAWQILGGKALERDPRVRPPITNYEVVKGWTTGGWDDGASREGPLEGVVTLQEAVDFVLENAPYYEQRVDEADIIAELERLRPQLEGMTETRFRRLFDVPNLGRQKVQEALDAGPDHPNFGKLVAHRRKARQEDHALAELVSEYQEPMHHVALNELANNLFEDFTYNETLPPEQRENLLLRTFLWGVEDPATGTQATLPMILAAIGAGRGRLFARILTEYQACLGATGEPIPEEVPDAVPFDVPAVEGEEIEAFEAPRRKPEQALVPGFLTAVATTPTGPVQREGKAKTDFTDQPLFTQEKDRAAKDAEKKAREAQGSFEFEAPRPFPPFFVSAPDDPFFGRYGPPPRKPTQEQIEARTKWLDLLSGGGKIGGSRGEGTAVHPHTGAVGNAGKVAPPVERPDTGGAGGAQPAGTSGGPRGGERGLVGGPQSGGAQGRPREGAARPAGQGVFRIFDPRAEFTHAQAPNYELIPKRLRGLDASDRPFLSEEQLVGVAKALQALNDQGAFLFEDGTGVGKTREILAVAHAFATGAVGQAANPRFAKVSDEDLEAYWRQEAGTGAVNAQENAREIKAEIERRAGAGKKWKVLVVSKSGAITPFKGPDGKWRVSGSFANDSAAMGIPIEFTRERGALEPGKIVVGTYHNLIDYQVDADTVLILDEAHQLKNAGDSEVSSQGAHLLNRAGRVVFATATPGDKPYHMSYLARIGFLEGEPADVALKKLGCVVKRRKKVSKAKFLRLVQAGVPPDEAREQATETIQVWKTVSPRKTEKAVEELFERLTAKGTVVKREVDLSPIDARFITVPLSEEGRAVMALIERGKFDRKNALMHMRRQQEPFKLAKVQELTLGELAEGRQVVIYAARVNRSDVVERFTDPRTGQLIERIIASSEGTLKQLREWLKEQGIPYAEIHGDAEETSPDAQRRFQSSKAKVVIATYERGGTGINLDDTTGQAPRSMIMMTAPFGSTDLVQAIGRIHRFTTMTPSRVLMLFTDHPVDSWNASILAGKIRHLHAMVSGDVTLLDPGILSGAEEAQGAAVHYKDAVLALSRIMGSGYVVGGAGYNNPITSAKHWDRIVRAVREMGGDLTKKGGEFEIPTKEGFVISGSIVRGGAAALGRKNVYGTARWDHDPEAGDLAKTIRLESEAPPPERRGPDITHVLAKLRELHYEPGTKPLVSQRQYHFHLDTLNRLGAVFGQRAGSPGAFRIKTRQGITVAGELVPPRTNEMGRAEPGGEGGFWWQQLGGEAGPGVGAVRSLYGKRARQIETLLDDLEGEGMAWRDLYERHVEVVNRLFGNDAPLFLKLLAVTSQAADVRANVALAMKAYRQLRYGTSFVGYLPNVRRALERIRDGELEYAQGPKIKPFALALTAEDVDAIAVDRHVGRFILGEAWNGKPGQIDFIRGLLLEAAQLLGWTGREVQGAVWALSQIEQGITPEEVEHYDQVLIERAAEIRRFRDYFGDVAGPGGWSGRALAALDSRAAAGERSSDPGLDSRVLVSEGGSEAFGGEIPVYERPLLNWKRPAYAGKGVGLLPGKAVGPAGPTVAATAIREGFRRLGRVEWDGMLVRDVEGAAAVYQTVRNPSLEHLAFFLIGEDGSIVSSFQATSNSPTYVAFGPDDRLFHWIRSRIDHFTAAGRKIKGVVGLHNHPSGNPMPSDNDVRFCESMKVQFGDRWLGGVVINHERAVIVRPDGSQYGIVRSLEGAVDPDPFLADGFTVASYYGPESALQIRDEEDLRSWANGALAARLAQKDDFGVIFLDGQHRLRLVVTVPAELLQLERQFRAQVTQAARVAGAHTAILVGPQTDPVQDMLIQGYLEDGLVQDHLVFGRKTSARAELEAAGKRDLPYDMTWRYLLAAEEADRRRWGKQRYTAAYDFGLMHVMEPPSRYGAGAPEPPAGQGGASAPGAPPPEPPGRRPSESEEDWWERRVRYARARLRSRMAEAASFIDPRAFWDAVVLGLDAVRRGLRTFGRWLADLARAIPHIGRWGRALWNYIRGLGAPVEREGRTRPRPFEEAAERAEAEVGRPGEFRGPTRPIPSVTTQEIMRLVEAFLRGEPPDMGAGKPTKVGRADDLAVNVNTVRNEADIRNAMALIIRTLQPVFDRIRLPKTEAQIRQLALELGYNEADFARLAREKGALTAQEIIAGRVLRQMAGVDSQAKFSEWVAAMDGVRRVRERFANGQATAEDVDAAQLAGLEAEREMRAGLQKFAGMMYATAAAGSEAGRALYAHRMLVQTLTPEERFFRHLFRGNRIDQRQLAQLIEAIRRGDMSEAGRLIRRIDRPGFWRTIGEYFVNSLISGPPTFAANVLGNLAHEGLRTAETGIAARLEQAGLRQGLERLLTGEAKPTERVLGEMTEAIKAQARWKFGILDALKFAWESIGHEDVRWMTGIKGELYTPAIPGLFGKIVRTPGRIMEALDLGAKFNAMAAERAKQVWRRAILEGAERGGWENREALQSRVTELDNTLGRWIDLEEARLADVQEFNRVHGEAGRRFLYENKSMSRIYDAMKEAANESTFRDQTTKFTNYVKALRREYPWLQFVIPFISTPERILVQALRRTPAGLAKTVWNIRSGKVSGGLASDRLAQGVLGSMVSAAVYMLAKNGLVTGGGPANPDERRDWLKTGKQPYAIKVGDEWISLQRLEPIATTLGFAADLAEATDQKMAGDIWDKLHYSVINNIASKTYLEGLISAAEAVGDPERYGARVWKQMLGAAVPNLLAVAARSIDPTIRQTDSISETLLARVPILSERNPARLTGTGEPVLRGENALSRFFSPFRYSPEAGPEANLERLFLETGYNPSAPPKSMSVPGGMGRKVELTSDERRAYAAVAARATAFARTLTANDDWGSLDVYAKEELLKRIYRFAHDAAMRQVWGSVLSRMGSGAAQLVAHR